MATLQKLRDKGPVLIIVVGLALFAFIAGDAWRIFQPGQSIPSAGSINGEEITAADFQTAFEEYSNVIKINSNKNSLTEEELTWVKEQTWNSLVEAKIINDEAEKLGLSITDAELQEIVNSGAHPMLQQVFIFANQQTGRFDADYLNNFLAQYEQIKNDPTVAGQAEPLYNYWMFFEKNLANSLLAQKYMALLENSFISNDIAAKYNSDAYNTTYDIEVKAFPYTAIPDSVVSVSNADIKDKYNSQKELYKVNNESRNIKYVSYRVEPSAQDHTEMNKVMTEWADSLKSGNTDYATIVRLSNSEVPYSTLAWSKDAYPEEIRARIDSVSANEVVGPIRNADNTYTVFKYLSSETVSDSIRYKMLVVATDAAEKTTTLTDSLLNVLKGGANFAEVAKKYNQNGEETWLTSAMYEGMSVDASNVAFLDALLAAKAGEFKTMDVQGTNNKIIYYVSEKRNPETKYNVVVVKEKLERSEETYKEAYNRFSHFVASCQSVEDLEAKAEEFGFRVMSQNNILANQTQIANIKGTNETHRWIFSEAEVGEISAIDECGNNDNLLVAGLVKVNEKGYALLDDLAPILRLDVIKDKKAEKIIADIKGKNFNELSSVANVKSGSVNRIAFGSPAYINVTSSSEPAISAAVTKLNEGEESAPIKGASAVYVIKLTKKNVKETADLKSEREKLIRQNTRNIAGMMMQDLSEKANVTDSRYLYF